MRGVASSRGLATVVVVLLAVGAGAAPVGAASMGELKAQADGVAITPGAGGDAEEAAIDRLGRIALQFLDALDTGPSGAAATYRAIVTPLERSHEAHRAALDRLSQRVVDEDGDMDALFASPVWHEHQALATQSLYYLNWLYYQGAQLFGGAERKALLEKAANGFGEFATAGGASPVVVESHLGRGLANLELDQVDWAIADFEAVVNAKGAAPERVRKATLALAEAYVRAGRSADALRASERALAGATAADLPRARLARARALLMAAASQAGRRAAYQSEAQMLLTQLRDGGGPWGNRAAGFLRMGLDDPRIWAAGRGRAPKRPRAGGKGKEHPPPPPAAPLGMGRDQEAGGPRQVPGGHPASPAHAGVEERGRSRASQRGAVPAGSRVLQARRSRRRRDRPRRGARRGREGVLP
jgi:hypothetical protein